MTTTSNLITNGRESSGRFAKGSSGNPQGRPTKKKELPWSLSSSIAAALAAEVEGYEGGKPVRLKMRDYIVKDLVMSLPKAKPAEKMRILDQFLRMGAFEEETAIEDQEIFTEEDRLLIKMVEASLKVSPCEHCGMPPYEPGAG